MIASSLDTGIRYSASFTGLVHPAFDLDAGAGREPGHRRPWCAPDGARRARASYNAFTPRSSPRSVRKIATLATSAHARRSRRAPRRCWRAPGRPRPRCHPRPARRRRPSPTWPDSTTQSPARTAGEYGPATGGARRRGQRLARHQRRSMVDGFGLCQLSGSRDQTVLLRSGPTCGPGTGWPGSWSVSTLSTTRHAASTPSSRANSSVSPSIASPSSRSYGASPRPGGRRRGTARRLSPMKPSPGAFARTPDRDRDLRVELEAQVVGVVRHLLVLGEHALRRTVELDPHLGARRPAGPCRRGRRTGTPAQRHESMCRRTAANVSTSESGATPGSSR